MCDIQSCQCQFPGNKGNVFFMLPDLRPCGRCRRDQWPEHKLNTGTVGRFSHCPKVGCGIWGIKTWQLLILTCVLYWLCCTSWGGPFFNQWVPDWNPCCEPWEQAPAEAVFILSGHIPNTNLAGKGILLTYLILNLDHNPKLMPIKCHSNECILSQSSWEICK